MLAPSPENFFSLIIYGCQLSAKTIFNIFPLHDKNLELQQFEI